MVHKTNFREDVSEAYSESSQKLEMELFRKIVHNFFSQKAPP